MSGHLRGCNVKWGSSTEEEDTCESKYNMRSRESLRNTKQPVSRENENVVVEPRKRGRSPSKRPCLNKNALMARQNRLKKKAYLDKIENKLAFYQQENKNLVTIIKKQAIEIKRLSSEVSYLKSVLNNNTSITALLKTINDGLCKINVQKKNSSHLTRASDHSIGMNGQQRDPCYINVSNDLLTGDNIIGNQRNESCINEKKPFTFDIKNNHQNEQALNTIQATSYISEDSYMDNAKDMDDFLPIIEAKFNNPEKKKDIDLTTMDLDQLSSFNMDIFEDLPKCDDMMYTMENVNNDFNLFTEDAISQTLDNTGICLHVNSDKVSLEFCSACHLNSKTTEFN